MVMLEKRNQLRTLSEERVKIESQLNRLNIDKGNLLKQKENNLRALEYNTRRQIENKREIFAMQMDIDKTINEQEQRLRQGKIDSLKKQQPSFDDLLWKEITSLYKEGEELGMELEAGIGASELWSRYLAIQNERTPTREVVILQEASGHFDGLLTSLLNKEIDGDRIDLQEKRNLKMPIINFLNNRLIKNVLGI